MMGSENEIVAIVDRENYIVGSATRYKMRSEGLIHRATYVLVFDSQGRLFVHKRTTSKDIYPGFYDIAAGGVVLAEESYEESAQRELGEELGIFTAILRFHFDNFFEDAGNRVWGRIFSCIYEGPMVLQKEEVESGFFMDVTDIHNFAKKEPFTPDGLIILKRMGENGLD